MTNPESQLLSVTLIAMNAVQPDAASRKTQAQIRDREVHDQRAVGHVAMKSERLMADLENEDGERWDGLS